MPSSVIRTHDYDPARRRLTITFQSGIRYAYRDVPAEVAAGLDDAASWGEYFNAAIRDHYGFERLR
ncbi:KTSC domain-containing protein [uncultured Sphingomonas sp.]|uniref:KTSC domain-containing protein n=1 Tax=uncultured Sphingomonas sp. TaxID=158754 RepID=UPI0025DC832B|nr:KTSC domain-containing protein [uncultured Sphingomonas sp.]